MICMDCVPANGIRKKITTDPLKAILKFRKCSAAESTLKMQHASVDQCNIVHCVCVCVLYWPTLKWRKRKRKKERKYIMCKFNELTNVVHSELLIVRRNCGPHARMQFVIGTKININMIWSCHIVDCWICTTIQRKCACNAMPFGTNLYTNWAQMHILINEYRYIPAS